MIRATSAIALLVLGFGCSEEKKQQQPLVAAGGAGGTGGSSGMAGTAGTTNTNSGDPSPTSNMAGGSNSAPATGNGEPSQSLDAGLPGSGGAEGTASSDPAENFDAGMIASGLLSDGGTRNKLCSGANEVSWATGNRCYRVVLAEQSWAQAAAECSRWSNGTGHLVSITSPEEDAFLTPYSEGRIWIGATDAPSEGTYQWISGETWSYTNFAEGQPTNKDGLEHCIEKLQGGKWNDLQCGVSRQFICEKQLAPLAVTATE